MRWLFWEGGGSEVDFSAKGNPLDTAHTALENILAFLETSVARSWDFDRRCRGPARSIGGAWRGLPLRWRLLLFAPVA